MNPENNSVNSGQEKSIYQRLLQIFVVASLFLLPVFFLPTTTMSLYSAKLAVLATLGLVSLIVFLSALLVNGQVSIPKEKMLIPLILIPIIATISALVNGSFTKSFMGTIFEINTAAFLVIGIVFALLTALSVKKEETLLKSIKFFILGACVMLLVIILKILASYGVFPVSFLSFIPDYLALGSIDTLIILGGAMLLAVNAFMFGQVRGTLQKIVMGVLIAGSLLFAGAIGFKTFIILVALFALVHFIYTISLSKMPTNNSDTGDLRAHSTSTLSNSSLVSLFILALSVVLILGGNTFSSFLSSTLRVSNVDVRPNFSTTVELIGSSFKTNPILGVGPNKFSNLWNAEKPDGINVTNFWNTDFNNGFSYALTLIAETGILGTLALGAFLVFLILAGFRAVFNQNLDLQKRFIVTSLFLVTLYLWVMTFLYTVNIVVLGVTFLLTGIFVASLGIFQISAKKEFNLFGNPKANFISIFILVVVLLFSISAGYFIWEKIVATSIFDKGERVLQTGNTTSAIDYLVQAALLSSSDVYWRGVANTYTIVLQNKIATLDPKAPLDASMRDELQNYIGSAIAAAQNAIKIDNKNYLNHFILGNVYEILSRAGVEGALTNARTNYEEARKFSPKNPGILLMLARISVLEGKADVAFEEIQQALALKPNFTDAFFLKAQIEVSNKNIAGAVKSVEDASLIDPQNSGLYFQLGLLKYNQKDWTGASVAFERAIVLVPDYANPKYFLGLSYSMLGKDSEALKQFEDLDKTNPDNKEIQFILQNLKAGRDPFVNVKPPADNKPEKRTTPPLEE